MCLGDINVHVGRCINGFDCVHGGYGVGQGNLEGTMLLEFCLGTELWVKYMNKERRKKEDDIQNG